MEPLMYVMAIMGCGDGGEACQQQRLVPTRYVSMAACQAASESQLELNTDLWFPTIMASCRPTANQVASVQSGDRG